MTHIDGTIFVSNNVWHHSDDLTGDGWKPAQVVKAHFEDALDHHNHSHDIRVSQDHSFDSYRRADEQTTDGALAAFRLEYLPSNPDEAQDVNLLLVHSETLSGPNLSTNSEPGNNPAGCIAYGESIAEHTYAADRYGNTSSNIEDQIRNCIHEMGHQMNFDCDYGVQYLRQDFQQVETPMGCGGQTNACSEESPLGDCATSCTASTDVDLHDMYYSCCANTLMGGVEGNEIWVDRFEDGDLSEYEIDPNVSNSVTAKVQSVSAPPRLAGDKTGLFLEDDSGIGTNLIVRTKNDLDWSSTEYKFRYLIRCTSFPNQPWNDGSLGWRGTPGESNDSHIKIGTFATDSDANQKPFRIKGEGVKSIEKETSMTWEENIWYWVLGKVQYNDEVYDDNIAAAKIWKQNSRVDLRPKGDPPNDGSIKPKRWDAISTIESSDMSDKVFIRVDGRSEPVSIEIPYMRWANAFIPPTNPCG